MIKTKYQIFVSSTYEDLKDERDLVIKSILEMGHIPVGMEMFSAADEEQWKIIQRQIDDCDYYVIIIAFRYGSLDGNISYTEKEYDYAISKGIPVIGFIIDENIDWPASKIDRDTSSVSKLETFKNKVKRKPVGFWHSKMDLYGKVSIALMKQFTSNPRMGWVRADEYTNPEILKEISRLSKENSDLRAELNVTRINEIIDLRNEKDEIINVLKSNERRIGFRYLSSHKFEDHIKISLFSIFNELAPQLIIESSTNNCASALSVFRPDTSKSMKGDWPTPSNVVRSILLDLNILELIEPSSKPHSLQDTNDYWTLTEKGRNIYKEVRKEILLKNLQKEDEYREDEEGKSEV